jgi:hypothetical protein
MSLWDRDSRIEEGTALRDLEKKVHFLMVQLAQNDILTINTSSVNPSDDLNTDANEVLNDAPR